MPTYLSDADIEQLISCAKSFKHKKAPKKEEVLKDLNYLNWALLVNDADQEFRMFTRRNSIFIENFSIGLDYLPRDGTTPIPLIRCNGQHGDQLNRLKDDSHHNKFHVHHAIEQAFSAGLNPLMHADVTDEYGTFQEALAFFVRKVNIIGAEKYFDINPQSRLL